jgi:hypothetical protein
MARYRLTRETDSKKYLSMESGWAGYKIKMIEDIPKRHEGSKVILHLSDRYQLSICMSWNFDCYLCAGEQRKCNGEREICILMNLGFCI